MKYRVRWAKAARAQLTTVWLNAADRNAVTSASHRIDQILARNPHSAGESRDRGRRLLIVPPLMVVYRVIDAKHTVRVVSTKPSRSQI
jgi:plasmid stabilization system protein ParE